MTLIIEQFSDPSIFDTLGSEWTELERKMYPRSPFASVMWHKTWWSHLRRDTRLCRDTLSIYTVREANGRLIAIAPFMLTKRPGPGPVGLYELQALGADPNITELRCVICQPLHQSLVMQALKDHLKASGTCPNWITWHTVKWAENAQRHSPPGGLQSQKYIWSRPSPAYMVPLTASWSTFEAGIKKKIRHNLKTRRNALTRNGHTVEFFAVSDPNQIGKALETFYELVRLRSQVRHNNPFDSEKIRQFYFDYAVGSAKNGNICIFQLLIDGEVVASRLGHRLEQELFLHTSGNNPAWDRFGVMTMLLAGIFKWAIENGFREVNLSTGLDPAKAQWRPREIMFVDAIDLMPGRLNAALYHLYSRIKTDGATASSAALKQVTAEVSLPTYYDSNTASATQDAA
jgi:CelD/BcsL family acetyltransferase involved in cellulose biosynthesis